MSKNKEVRLSRRDLIKIVGVTAITSGTAGYLISELDNEDKEKKPVSLSEKTPFNDKQANEIAKMLDISPGSFFIFSQDVLDKLEAFKKDTLYPIYPPAVLSYKNLIYDLSHEFKVPPNIIATLISIESCGVKSAESYAGAQGLFQVMPFHFPREIQKNPEAMRDPHTNGKTALNYFTKECLVKAKDGTPGFSQKHPVFWARAFLAYNAGQNGALLPFELLPEETKFYGDHMIRYLMTAEIAEGLRVKGNDDQNIIKKLSSLEIDARSYALNEHFLQMQGFSYNQYMQTLQELARNTPGFDDLIGKPSTKGKQYHNDYKIYLSNPSYKLPASPALRIWLALGGYTLFSQDNKNLDINEWEKISTSKPSWIDKLKTLGRE